MAVSGSTNYSINRDTIIEEAMEILNVYDPVSTLSAEDVNSCSRSLNLMLKALQNEGLNLWMMKEVHLFMEADKIKYTLSTSGDHATESHTETAVKVAGVATDTSLDVDSTTGMTAADYIGVELDDGTMHWTTVSSVTDSDTVVLTDALPSAAAIDNVVYFYTTKIPKPLAITNAFLREHSSSNDVELDIISREEYWNLGTKTTEGTVTQIYFDPRRDDSEVRVYAEPTDVTDYLVLICQFPFDDMDAAANTPDFPQEWFETVVWNLAVRLMYKFGGAVTRDRRQEIRSIAKEMLNNSLAFDAEKTSIFFQPENR